MARIEVDLGPMVHGGHALAHHDGRPVFVRHGLPGERVVVEITDVTRTATRGSVVEVLSASVDRVVAPCPHTARCGGCDFQHVELTAQRSIKTSVLHDALRRTGGFSAQDIALMGAVVSGVPGDATGLRYRTRMRWAPAPAGWGLRAHRRHDVVAVDDCLIAVEGLASPPVAPPGGSEAVAAWGSDDRATTMVGTSVEGPAWVHQVVGDRTWRLRASSFWQVHRNAPTLLSERVGALALSGPGQTWWDLYSGAGLVSATLAAGVGEEGSVVAVEGAAASVREARRALHDLHQVRLVHADVQEWLPDQSARPDGIVLDPPRAGAGAAVCAELVRLGAPRLVYVSCDPVTLARDLATLRDGGYDVAHIEGWDLFPMTHHLEAIAVLTRS